MFLYHGGPRRKTLCQRALIKKKNEILIGILEILGVRSLKSFFYLRIFMFLFLRIAKKYVHLYKKRLTYRAENDRIVKIKRRREQNETRDYKKT